MKTRSLFILTTIMGISSIILNAQKSEFTQPVVGEENNYEEKEGLVIVEAEYFYKQSNYEKRQWYRTSKLESPQLGQDVEENPLNSASNNAYIEILPDTRINHSDKLIHGENFSNDPGKAAIVHYKVKINNPGRYYIWARAFSTGSEDNSIHVGLNNEWPVHGQRMQWCEGKNKWTWESKQRTKDVHCGVPKKIYLDIEKSGIHDIQFSMREDGFVFDKFLMTNDIDYIPKEQGTAVSASLPVTTYFQTISSTVLENKTLPVDDFPIDATSFYKDADGKWLAIEPEKNKEAQTTTTFNFKSANYDILLVAVGENDGRSKFTVHINDKELGSYSPPLAKKIFEEGKNYNALWENVSLKKGDKISVKSIIGSEDGKEWARGRWSGIIFAPVGKGKEVQQTPFDPSPDETEITKLTIKPPMGRIAIVADGNSPDPDDLGGTAVSIALLRASGLENRLVHYSHSCDLVRDNRISEAAEKERHALMQAACDVTARRWGGFDGLTFLDAKWQQEKTVKDLSTAINASSKEDPLWIIEAGEPDILGMALAASKKSKHKYVKVITHHPANDDAGDFYTWQQILDFGVEEVRIPDQNTYLKVALPEWDWAKNHLDPRMQWVWIQGKIAEVDDVVTFQKGKWDCSDAGMVLYWITGATNGGLTLGTVNDIKKILLYFIENSEDN